ncbi:MAG: hypothetical protein ACK56I_08810, partial [bacterium]
TPKTPRHRPLPDTRSTSPVRPESTRNRATLVGCSAPIQNNSSPSGAGQGECSLCQVDPRWPNTDRTEGCTDPNLFSAQRHGCLPPNAQRSGHRGPAAVGRESGV